MENSQITPRPASANLGPTDLPDLFKKYCSLVLGLLPTKKVSLEVQEWRPVDCC